MLLNLERKKEERDKAVGLVGLKNMRVGEKKISGVRSANGFCAQGDRVPAALVVPAGIGILAVAYRYLYSAFIGKAVITICSYNNMIE